MIHRHEHHHRPIPIVELTGVEMSFGGSGEDQKLKVLEDINLTVQEHDVMALLGPSGCGKSTIMRVPLRPHSTHRGHRKIPRHAPQWREPRRRHGLPEFRPFPLAHRAREHPPRPREFRLRRARTRAPLPENHRDGRPRRLRRRPPQGTLRRHEAARRHRPRAHHGAADPLHGRALQRARRPHRRNASATKSAVSPPIPPPVSRASSSSPTTSRGRLPRPQHRRPRRPSRSRAKIVPNPLPYPRDPASPAFQQLVAQIHAILTNSVLDDAPVEPAQESATPAHAEETYIPLPGVTMGEVVGLIGMLGPEPESLFALTTRLKKDFSTFLSVIKAAELIDLVETPGQTVHLTKMGVAFNHSDLQQRKTLMHALLLDLQIFRHFNEKLDHSETHELSEEEVLADLAEIFPNERPKNVLKTLVGWARYAELFSYDPRTAILKKFEKAYLGKPPASRSKS